MIQALREGRLHVVAPAGFIGMASMPSFHTCAAVLMQWSLRHARVLRWPALFVNVGMAVGAIVIGSHYLVDIIAGLFLAVGCIFVTRRLVATQ